VDYVQRMGCFRHPRWYVSAEFEDLRVREPQRPVRQVNWPYDRRLGGHSRDTSASPPTIAATRTESFIAVLP
jgi:hypothetical protein